MANVDLSIPPLHGETYRDDDVREAAKELFDRWSSGDPEALQELLELAEASERRDAPTLVASDR